MRSNNRSSDTCALATAPVTASIIFSSLPAVAIDTSTGNLTTAAVGVLKASLQSAVASTVCATCSVAVQRVLETGSGKALFVAAARRLQAGGVAVTFSTTGGSTAQLAAVTVAASSPAFAAAATAAIAAQPGYAGVAASSVATSSATASASPSVAASSMSASAAAAAEKPPALLALLALLLLPPLAYLVCYVRKASPREGGGKASLAINAPPDPEVASQVGGRTTA